MTADVLLRPAGMLSTQIDHWYPFLSRGFACCARALPLEVRPHWGPQTPQCTTGVPIQSAENTVLNIPWSVLLILKGLDKRDMLFFWIVTDFELSMVSVSGQNTILNLLVLVFFDEVIGTLERALEENIGYDNMVLEINSLKYVSSSFAFHQHFKHFKQYIHWKIHNERCTFRQTLVVRTHWSPRNFVRIAKHQTIPYHIKHYTVKKFIQIILCGW